MANIFISDTVLLDLCKKTIKYIYSFIHFPAFSLIIFGYFAWKRWMSGNANTKKSKFDSLNICTVAIIVVAYIIFPGDCICLGISLYILDSSVEQLKSSWSIL